VLYLDLAQRCGMKGLFGSSLPLRFMVGWQADPEGEILLVDVSQQGRIITPEEVANDLEIADVAELRYALEPASEKDIILRMVNNLTAGVRNGEVEVTAKSAGHLSLQIALSESAPRERILRAGYRQKMGDKAGAREDIGWILHHPPEGLNPLMVEQLQNLYQSLE
jgi:serine protease Do